MGNLLPIKPLKIIWKFESRSDHQASTTHQQANVYLIWWIDWLVASTEGEKSFALAPGRHTFSFSLYLPNSLAPSFEYRYGKIIYKVNVIIYRHWKMPKTYTKPFTIVRTREQFPSLSLLVIIFFEFDLTNIESLSSFIIYFFVFFCPVLNRQIPREKRLIQQPRFFRSGPITARIYLLRDRYLPGEKVIVTAEVINNSGRAIKSSKIRLMQVYYKWSSPLPSVVSSDAVINYICVRMSSTWLTGLRVSIRR